MAGNGKRSLKEILEEHLAETKAGFARIEGQFLELGAETKGLRADINEGFRALRTELIAGLTQVRTEVRKPLASHEDRITALEADIAKLKAG